MKAFAVIFILSCLSLCIVHSERVQRWGYVGSTILGKQTIIAEKQPGQIQVRAFAFSGVSKMNFCYKYKLLKLIAYFSPPDSKLNRI